ncbi:MULTISPECIES: SDR family oxidoreductase [Rhizobium]|uniref:SDR family oxidoreductase n=1 Tax=Rhizobium TaxID=379 RepID=UPI000376515A|nr:MULTISPECIES: SDR family oxidoreductase [Rhizobium]MBY3211734.1 SDR family oxidoreductase [Rhizobium laguerreae]
MTKVVIITGAGTGMGRLVARSLAQTGHTVYATMRFVEGGNRDKAEEARAFATDHEVNLRPLELDVNSDASIEQAVQTVTANEGRIDVLVHNAAHLYFGITEAFTPEQILASLNTNTVGALRVNRRVLPVMREQGSGLLLWIGSGTSRVVPPFLAPYTAAKAAMDSFADSISYEVARFGIETSILMPGPFVEGTAHFPHAEFPADETVQNEYLALYEDAIVGNEQATRALFPEGVTADVKAVADEALRIIGLPHGSRPYRSEVDFSDFGDAPVNAVATVMRERLLKRFGLSDLLHPTNFRSQGK